MTTRPNSRMNAPVTHDHNGSASNCESIVRMSVGRKAAVPAMMAKYGPITRANVRVLSWAECDDSIGLPPLKAVLRQDDGRCCCSRDALISSEYRIACLPRCDRVRSPGASGPFVTM